MTTLSPQATAEVLADEAMAEAPARSRPFLPGMLRGLRGRCPSCAQGRLYRSYLKVQACPACGHDNLQYPSDDAGPYFTILLVGHIVVAPLLCLPFIWTAPVALVLGTTLPAIGGLTLLFLSRVKGTIVGLMWALNCKGDPSAEAV